MSATPLLKTILLSKRKSASRNFRASWQQLGLTTKSTLKYLGSKLFGAKCRLGVGGQKTKIIFENFVFDF